MRKLHLALCALLLLALVPQTYAWKLKTHYDVAEAAYNALPQEVRDNLNLDEIKRGSVAPDNESFGQHHRYPNTVTQTQYWLGYALDEYLAGGYDNASYALGVACHFIADSTVVPYHNVSIQNFELHDEYEATGAGFTPASPSYIENFNISAALTAFNQGAYNRLSLWTASETSKKASMVREDVDRAATFTYNAWVQTLGIEVPVSKSSIFIDARVIAVIVLVVIVVVIVISANRFYRE